MRASLRVPAVAAALAVCAVSGVALAGAKYGNGVFYVTSTNVYGSMYATRYSSNSVEYIGCEVFTNVGQAPSAVCFANDANNRYASCYTEDAHFVSVASAITPISSIQFTWNATSGECTYISVYSSSSMLP